MKINLRDMSQSEYKDYLKRAIPSYAKEHSKTMDTSFEEQLEVATKEFENLLPNGLSTEHHYLKTALMDNQPIGLLWFAKKSVLNTSFAYIYEIEIFEEFRGRGYSKELMKLLEQEVKKLDLKSIKLHVFGHNVVARSLYEKMGYKVKNLVMAKEL